MSEAVVTVETRGPVAWITLHRPVIGAAEILALHDACAATLDDSKARAIVLTGTSDAFAAGWESEGFEPQVADPFGCFAEASKPVLAAINGDAIGGCLALVLAADIRMTVDTALFGFPEADCGMLPFAGATQRLARLVGRGKALEMILTGESIDASEALRIGLVSEVVPADKLATRAQEIAELLATRGPVALQYAKEAVNRGIDMPLEQALRFETDLTVILQTTEDRAEGVRAFMEKRKPDFKGR